MADIANLAASSNVAKAQNSTSRKGSNELSMQDFLQLMVVQLQNQTIDNAMDTSEMMNQMVQMQMVTALANMTDASIMSYAASLVGKEVTVAQINSDGDMEELVGVVKGTGTKNGEQVIFLDNDKYYYMNEIMAVGRLPEKEEEDSSDKTEGSGSAADSSGGAGAAGGSTSAPEAGGTTDQTQGSGETDEAPAGRDETTGRAFVPDAPLVSDTENEYHGESGVPTETEI